VVRPKLAVVGLPPWYLPAFAKLVQDLQVPTDFPADVTAAAQQAAGVVHAADADRADRREIELVTLDPADSRDLDQAFAIEQSDRGFRLYYAIADVAAFVEPGGPIDVESNRRVETRYAPDRRLPLHPPELSEAAASLLPGVERPAVLWTLDLDAGGELVGVDVGRARVKSRAKLAYDAVQAEIDAGTQDAVIDRLRALGELRLASERRRGAVSLPLPEQVVDVSDGGGWRLTHRLQTPVEMWNAQLSLLTGMAAATLMLGAGIGLLRTLPAPDPDSVAGLRRRARALGFEWPESQPYPEFVRSIDPNAPRAPAMLRACTTLFRGAGYLAFDGAPPTDGEHAAIAAPYAHVTAPLRRLADRYATEVCLAVKAGVPVPGWVRTALPELPQRMQEGGRAVNSFAAEVLNLVEAGLLAGRVGETFPGTVVATNNERTSGTVVIADPYVEAKVDGRDLPLGEAVQVRLVTADPMTRQIRFEASG
jgi:exoribonuclease R